LGNDAVVLVGFQNDVRLYPLFQIFFVILFRVKEIHPSVNMSNKTIITDQDKGSLASIIEILPSAHPFLCAFHRRQNIVKKFGGGKGDMSATCSLVYNIFMKCNSVATIGIYACII
jgi:hypothetical protein